MTNEICCECYPCDDFSRTSHNALFMNNDVHYQQWILSSFVVELIILQIVLLSSVNFCFKSLLLPEFLENQFWVFTCIDFKSHAAHLFFYLEHISIFALNRYFSLISSWISLKLFLRIYMNRPTNICCRILKFHFLNFLEHISTFCFNRFFLL